MTVRHFTGKIVCDEETIASADGDVMISLVPPDPGLYGPVIEARRYPDNEFRCAPDALDYPQDLLMRIPCASLTHGKAIKQTGFAMISPEREFQDKRIFEITPGGFIRTRRSDSTMASFFPVEYAAETAPGV
jgi:hypothetical protein